MDVYPLSLDTAQFESIIILLSTKGRMTTKAMQRTLEYANIFEFLEEVRTEVNKKAEAFYEDLVTKQNYGIKAFTRPIQNEIMQKMVDAKAGLIEKDIRDRKIQGKLLKEEIIKYIGDPEEHVLTKFRIDSNGFKVFMLTKDGFGSSEKKRSGVISEIKKLTNLNIPSYDVIKDGLEKLRENGYVDYLRAKNDVEDDVNKKRLRAGADGAWYITDVFYKIWTKKRLKIIEEYNEIAQKWKGSHLTPDGRAIQVSIEKYGVKMLDFYLVAVNQRKRYRPYIQSQYLIHQQEVSIVFRD